MGKKILLGLSAVLVLGLVIGFLLPSHVDVERSLVIHAGSDKIHPYLEDFKRWNEWTPWSQESDPTVVYSYAGSEKGEGAQMSWTSKKMGDGHMTLLKSDPHSGIGYEFRMDDKNMVSHGLISYKAISEGTQVTWKDSFDLGRNPISRYFGLCIDFMLGKDFDKGLAKLKLLVENNSVEKAQ